MGAILYQLVPHQFKDVDNREKRKEFLSQTAALLKERMKDKTYSYCFDNYEESSWGQIWIEHERISLYLCSDFWRIQYPYHYAQIVINNNGILEARNKCYEMAKILGSNYSHYCDEYCYVPYEDRDCFLYDILNDFKEKTSLFPAKYFKEHDWSEVNGHFKSHYDDYFEEL